jgi:4-aminobutyrate aminotransferase-like enzyme
MNRDDVLKKQRDFLFPAVKTYYEKPVILTHGDGARATDLDGKSYLDFFGGILTVSVGHAQEDVNQAVVAQIERLSHVSTLYPSIPMVTLAEKLAEITPGDLQKCFFTASGTEADEMAVMMAQVYTGNLELVALRHSYSGRSMLAQSMTAQSSWRAIPSQVAGIKHALAPYCYRCPLKKTYPECGVACAQDVEELIQTTTTGSIAGMIAEPILGIGGFITPPPEYFQVVANIVRKYGGVFIADEVQTGFGRTGKMWGVDQYGVKPDMMTMAKGIANGFPLGAVVALPAIADSLKKNSIATFGGNPVSTSAANATIGVILRDKLVENADQQGTVLRNGLEALQTKYPAVIGDVRGMGLMQALELVVDEAAGDRTPNPAAATRFMEETKKRGLLIGRGGLYANTLRIAPPLNITKAEVMEALGIMDQAFAAMH